MAKKQISIFLFRVHSRYRGQYSKMRIYHIVLPKVWAAFDGELYEHPSLAAEGFIHCSFDHQLDGVIERYYSGAPEIILLEIDSGKLTSELVSEPSTGGEIYPHIYGPINRDAIVSVTERDFERG